MTDSNDNVYYCIWIQATATAISLSPDYNALKFVTESKEAARKAATYWRRLIQADQSTDYEYKIKMYLDTPDDINLLLGSEAMDIHSLLAEYSMPSEIL